MKLHLKHGGGEPMPLRISDADFAADKENINSISVSVVYVNGIVAGCSCKKQGAVALPTAEAEFVAAAVGGRQALGVKDLFNEIGLLTRTPIVLKIDNQAAIKQLLVQQALNMGM